MIKPIFINKTELSPKVILDKENNIFLISGKSIVENAHEFYSPVLTWFKSYFNNPNNSTELILYLEYLNSSSSFQIANLIELFSENQDSKNLYITWLYDSDDEIMKETGKEFKYSDFTNFELKELKDEDYEEFSFDL